MFFYFFGERPSVVVTKPTTASGVSADSARRGGTGSGAEKPQRPPATKRRLLMPVDRRMDGVPQTAEMKLINKNHAREPFHLPAPQKGGKP